MIMYKYCYYCGRQLEPSEYTAIPMKTVTTYKENGEKFERYYCLACPMDINEQSSIYDIPIKKKTCSNLL